MVPGNLVRIHHTMYTNKITSSYSVTNLIVTPEQQLVPQMIFHYPDKSLVSVARLNPPWEGVLGLASETKKNHLGTRQGLGHARLATTSQSIVLY